MPKETNLEFKVGLFVLVALVALTVFIFSISDSSVFEKGKTLRVVFDFANGVKKSAPVRVAGVDEGIVKDIKLFFDPSDEKTKVEVELTIKKETKIPVDSVVFINQLGLLGEKYVEVTPGRDRKQFIQEGTTMIGRNPIAQEAISEKVMDVSKKLEEAIGGITTIIRDEQNVASIRKALQNISLLMGNLNDIAMDVKAGKGTVGRLFYNNQLYDDLEGLTADLKANPWKLLYRPKTAK